MIRVISKITKTICVQIIFKMNLFVYNFTYSTNGSGKKMPRPKQDQNVQSKQSRPGVYFTRVLGWFKKKAVPQHREAQGSGVDFTKVLPDAVTQNALGSQFFYPDVLSMSQTSKKLNGLFQVHVETLNALKHVVEGDVDALTPLIQENPGLLFKKGNVKAPRGQTYYNVSPYMLMKFLCDADMLAKIMALIPERFNPVRQAQNAEIGHGGSDLVKLDFDPMLITHDDFNKICAFKTNINVWGTSKDITFPLLENSDGLLYWKDAQGEVNFYYANRDTKTVIPLSPVATNPEEQLALEAFKLSFATMENNSARRSTNKEHQLISKLMQQALHRQGIHYSDAHGAHCCDSHTPFQLINHYRTSIRLYEEIHHNGQMAKAQQYWRESVGRAQGEEMWLLQRICEENQRFYPLPQNVDAFKRGFGCYNFISQTHESVFNNGKLTENLGRSFALYKANDKLRRQTEAMVVSNRSNVSANLISVCLLVEDAKTKTIGLALESDQVVPSTASPQH